MTLTSYFVLIMNQIAACMLYYNNHFLIISNIPFNQNFHW